MCYNDHTCIHVTGIYCIKTLQGFHVRLKFNIHKRNNNDIEKTV